jgi:hypothetical protein
MMLNDAAEGLDGQNVMLMFASYPTLAKLGWGTLVVRIDGSRKGLIGVCAFPHLKIEIWGTHGCAD